MIEPQMHIHLAKGDKIQLTEIEAKKLLREAGIPVTDTKLAKNKKEAVSLSRAMGFPVVLKIASPDIIHKSDSGGVKLQLKNATEVNKAYNEIMISVRRHCPGARIEGVTVQRMAHTAIELIIGVNRDEQFGPVVMFGLGGILVEVLKDVSYRLVPVTKKDAAEMIKEIRGYPLLIGFRGQESIDISSLEQMIVRVSDLIEKNPQIKELDINPIFAYKDGAVAVDARVIF